MRGLPECVECLFFKVTEPTEPQFSIQALFLLLVWAASLYVNDLYACTALLPHLGALRVVSVCICMYVSVCICMHAFECIRIYLDLLLF